MQPSDVLRRTAIRELVAQAFKADAAVGALHALAAYADLRPYRERGAAQRAFLACLDLRLLHTATSAGRVFELFCLSGEIHLFYKIQ